jgi:hypothetical protein
MYSPWDVSSILPVKFIWRVAFSRCQLTREVEGQRLLFLIQLWR